MLFTPAKDCGCRAGVIRRWVLEQGGIECREASGTVEDLMAAQEIFLTNSRIGILPVHDFEGFAFHPGEVTEHLRGRYSACLAPAEE
jgi:branched-subunit amino acid aminotransferase/4-amino-4-deoxychorismate lyase